MVGGDGFGKLLLVLQNIGEVEKRFGVIGLELGGAAECVLSFFVAAEGSERGAEVVEHDRRIGLVGEVLLESAHGLFETLEAMEGGADVGIGEERVGLNGEGLLEVFYGLGASVRRVAEEAHADEGIDVARAQGEDLFEKGFGFGVSAAHEELLGLREKLVVTGHGSVLRGGAPRAPHVAVGRLDVAGEAGGLTQGRCVHAVAHRGAEQHPLPRVGGQGRGDLNVLLGGMRDELGKGQIGKNGDTDAAGVALTGESYHGEPHPERLAGGGGAVVGKRVEGDIGLVVKSEMCGVGIGVSAEIEAVGGDALPGECVDERLLRRGSGKARGLEQQSRVGDGPQDARPESEQLRVDLGQGVEGTERDGLGGVAVEAHGLGVVGGAIAEEGFGETDEFFGGAFIGGAGGRLGIGEVIGETVIDGVEAGDRGITQVGHLDRRGLAGEGEEAVAGGVTGEVDEDVDLVFMDGACEAGMVEAGGLAPLVGEGLEAAGRGVGCWNVGVAKHLDLCGVVVGEEGFDEVADGVRAQVGGAVTDAKAAIGGAIIGVRSEAIGRSAVRFSPEGVGSAHGLGGLAGDALHGIKHVAVGNGIAGVKAQVFPEGGNGFFGAAETVQDAGDSAEG